MSQAVVERLQAQFGERVRETSAFRGDDEVVIDIGDWAEVATFLRDDEHTQMDHFVDLTAVDYPEREGARFDVLFSLRSNATRHRIRVKARIAEGTEPATLSEIYAGADWAEREVWDMFGIKFKDHPDMRRILLYEEFEGHPLRKDYPIDRAQPLVPYRDVGDVQKLPPFGIEEGQPFTRVDWERRLQGRDHQVSPAIGWQQGQRRTLSDSEAAEMLQKRLQERRAEAKVNEE